VKHVDLAGLLVEADSGTPLVLLREQDEPHRVVPIVIGGAEAAAIALALSDEPPERPATHDMMIDLVETLHAHLDRVEVTEVRDGSFRAALTIAGPTGERRLDSRPSDAIALAVRVDAPVYVSEEVLDEVGAVLTTVDGEPGDDEVLVLGPISDQPEEDVEEEVARLRAVLDELGPEAFGEDGDDGGP
jgi:bifunctional DNase/RNase